MQSRPNPDMTSCLESTQWYTGESLLFLGISWNFNLLYYYSQIVKIYPDQCKTAGDREDDDGEAALSGENPDTPTLLLVDLVISGTIYSGQMAPGLTGENVEKMIDQWNKGELQKEPNMKRKALRGK